MRKYDSLKLRLARVTLNLTLKGLAKTIDTSPQNVWMWERGTVEPSPRNLSLINSFISEVEANHGELRLPDRGGEDLTRLRKENKLTRKYISELTGISEDRLFRLEKEKDWELRPGIFDIVRKIKEIESVHGMPESFRTTELDRLRYLLTRKPRQISKLARTSPFSYWTILRWYKGSNIPRKRTVVKKLREWMLELETITVPEGENAGK